MGRSFWTLVAALLLSVAGGMAHATTLTYSNYSVIDGQTVTLSGNALGRQEVAQAGEIVLLGVNGGTGKLSTFCVEVAQWLTPSGQFSSGAYLVGSFADQVNALLSHVLPTIATNGNASAALQVAIWKAEYGSNLVVSGNTSVTDLAAQYLGYVRSGAWTPDRSMQVAFLDGGGQTQSQAYLARVPEPASLMVLAMGLFSLVVWRHWRRPSPASYSRLRSVSVNCRPAKDRLP